VHRVWASLTPLTSPSDPHAARQCGQLVGPDRLRPVPPACLSEPTHAPGAAGAGEKVSGREDPIPARGLCSSKMHDSNKV
jgi:hypothetical protein